MSREDTGYRWLRFIGSLQDIVGGALMVFGAAFFILSILSARAMHEAPKAIPIALGMLIGGIPLIALGQVMKAMADIADNSRSLPEILEYLREKAGPRELTLEPPFPEMGNDIPRD